VIEISIDQALQQGTEAYKAGQMQKADRLYSLILKAQPKHPEANHNMGILAVDVGKVEQALPFFKTALDANPAIVQFWLSYIDTLIKAEKFDDVTQTIADAKQAGVSKDKLQIHEEALQSKVGTGSDVPNQKLGIQLQGDKNALAPAIELREVGKYKEAQEWLRNFIGDNCDNAEALSLLSQILLLDKNDSEAEKILAAAARINPDLPSIYRNKARLLLKKAKTKEAVEEAKLGRAKSPEDLDTLNVLAACLGANQQASEALSIIKKILKVDVNYAEAYATRALIKLREKDRSGAFEDAKMTVSIKPHLVQMWFLLASMHYQDNNVNDAINALKIAHKYEPQNLELLAQLGSFLQQDNKTNEAIILLEQATKLSPRAANLWTNLGAMYQQEKRIQDATIAYENALAINPRAAAALSNLGAIAKESGELVLALQYFEKAREVEPNLVEVHSNLGVTLKELGRLVEAEESYNRAITLKPDYVEAHSNLGTMLRVLGRFDEAEASINRAIALKPDYAEAHNNLGVIFKELGRLNEAEAKYKQAITLKPDHIGAYENLGNVLSELNRHDEAVTSRQKTFTLRTGIRAIGDESLAPATNSLFFELTNKCNFHCTFCPSDSQTRDLGSMDLELIKNLYTETADKKLASVVNLHLMGEPTLHPKLIEILKFAAAKNVKTDLVTNGSTLVARVVPRILDALYGTVIASHMTPTQETYQFRGKVKLSWERYISNLRLLVREYMQRIADGVLIRNDITIRVMVTQNTATNVSIINDSNEANAILKEWNDFVAGIEQELGLAPFEREDHNLADLVRGNKFKSTSYQLQQGIKLTFWRAFTFANTRVSDDFELKPTDLDSYCPKPFSDVGVLWNGDVTLCGLDHDGELKVGNVRESSIETVIQSAAAQKLRAAMHGKYPLPSICQKCQERPVKRE